MTRSLTELFRYFAEKVKWFLIVNLFITFWLILALLYGDGIKCHCVNLPKSILAEEFPLPPVMPIGASQEITEFCGGGKCPCLFKWLEDMAIFRGQYEVFKLNHENKKK